MFKDNFLSGRTAIVTGASSGIGQRIALELGRFGASVVVNYRSDEKSAAQTVAQIEEYGSKAISVKADVGKEADVENMFAAAVSEFEQVDILINNAGMQQDNSIINMSIEEWQSVLQANLTGQFLCLRAAAREFLRGNRTQISNCAGSIVCISSVHELIPWAGHVNYASSKGGLALLMKTAAQELAPQQIRINSIAPGAIKTAINEESWKDKESREELVKLIPWGRIGDTQDIANVALFLVSDLASYIQGETIFVDGGMALYPEFASGG